jgi:hypothetical protein
LIREHGEVANLAALLEAERSTGDDAMRWRMVARRIANMTARRRAPRRAVDQHRSTSRI